MWLGFFSLILEIYVFFGFLGTFFFNLKMQVIFKLDIRFYGPVTGVGRSIIEHEAGVNQL